MRQGRTGRARRDRAGPLLPGKARASEKELTKAERLIVALSMSWDPGGFRDTFQEKVAALITAKRSYRCSCTSA
ncbi:hypothetical protein [Streptomyces sp. NPDC002104]